MTTLAEVGEARIIGLIREAFQPRQPLEYGIGDDAAVFQPRGRVVAAADAMVEGVHFDLGFCPPRAVGFKLVSVNVSDLAAMGADAERALLTISAPASLPWSALQELVGGVADASERYGLDVVGGDVTGSPGPLVLSLTMLGTPGARILTRDAAQPGDGLYVTGPLGLAAAGLERLQADPAATGPEVERFLRPEARTAAGRALATWKVRCAVMDLSDGLAVDAARMAAASGVDIVLQLDQLPTSHGERHALYGGEDYELLIATPEPPPFAAWRLGTVETGTGELHFERKNQRVAKPEGAGFGHFGE